VTLRMRTDM